MKGELKKLHLCSHVHVRKISFMYLGYFKSILEILNEMSWIFLFCPVATLLYEPNRISWRPEGRFKVARVNIDQKTSKFTRTRRPHQNY